MQIAPRRVHIGLIMLAFFGALQIAGDKDAKETKKPPAIDLPAADGGANAKWLSKMDDEDRKSLAEKLGKPIAPASPKVEWFGGAAPTSFTNCVTVIQSALDKSTGLNASEKLKKDLPPDVKFVVIMSTADAEKTKKQLEKKAPLLIALDPEGIWSALLGLPTKPANLVVDKRGNIRFAGLTPSGMKHACAFLLTEKIAPSDAGASAGGSATGTGASGAVTSGWIPKSNTPFPTFTNNVSTASDQRGNQLIPFFVQEWITKQPQMDNKLLVIDFWATWCPPCRASIPHMNQTAAKFAADVVCVGISNEIKSAFDTGMAKNKLDVASFTYSLALDPSNKLSSFFKVKAIPSCAVISSDGIVRWQGQPTELDDAILTKLVTAQKVLNASVKK